MGNTPTTVADIERVTPDGRATPTPDILAEETPIALVYNGISHVVMMATPADLVDFGLGFSLSEGIVGDKAEIYDIAIAPGERGIEVRMAISLERFTALKDRRRNLAGRTGCGICGVDSLEQALRSLPRVTSRFTLSLAAVFRALDELPSRQVLNKATRSVHAAAWVSGAGEIVLVREDVGRHNTLDKLIGAMSRGSMDFANGFALITSRCSVEMVQKAVALGMPVLVAISAPTALARRVADESGLTMLALARADSVEVVTHPHRIANLHRAETS